MGKKETQTATHEPRHNALFRAFDTDGDGRVSPMELTRQLELMGLSLSDARLRGALDEMKRTDGSLDELSFARIVSPNAQLIERALRGQLVIPEWRAFVDALSSIYDEVLPNDGGTVANYIPQLGRVDPDQFGVSVCTIDGQSFSLGEADVPFCVQSCCKPINYALTRQALGRDRVHQFIGREPSGRGFNELTLNHEGKPHNPMINAGAIIACSLISPEMGLADRFDSVMETWNQLAGGIRPGFNNSVYQSERKTADRNFALAYFMREHGAFPAGSDLHETLEFYFQCCSIEQTAQSLSIVAATLANAGVCPTTGEEVFDAHTVRDVVSLMSSCGMYDFSGEFAFTIGLPAKSGVSGTMIIVVPNVMGLAVWSPRLDRHGNSVRGVEFCEKLVENFNFHNYDNLTGLSDKQDPRVGQSRGAHEELNELIYAAASNDMITLRRLVARGVNPAAADYDGRTPLHLAASEGHADVVCALLSMGASADATDRWGNTPQDDAKRGDHDEVSALLERGHQPAAKKST